jgi:ketosteroid isomerase-like protein
MLKIGRLGTSFLLLAVIIAWLVPMNAQAQKPEDSIVAKERAALDRWKTGDTFGFVDIAADEITYFDPAIEKRCDGIQAFREYMASFRGTFSFPGYDLLNPKVQLYGDIGVLTFNFVGHSKDGKADRWNSTEVYRLIKGEWRLASSHWSHTKP